MFHLLCRTFRLVVAGIHLVLFEIGNGTTATPIELATRIRWLLLAGFVFVIIQSWCRFAFRATIPDDQTFARDEFETPFRLLFRQTWLGASIVSVFLLIVTISVVVAFWDGLTTTWDKYGLILLAVPLTPLLIPAVLVQREESKVLRRDEAYPDFIRALGGTVPARSAEPSATIRVRGIDFGMLDQSIDRLEKRLSTRIDSERAWDYFAADTNSAVISATIEYTSKVHNHQENQLRQLTWFHALLQICFSKAQKKSICVNNVWYLDC